MTYEGVHFIDRNSVFIDPESTIGPGTTVMPFVVIRGKTAIGKHCVIESHTVVVDSVVGDDCSIGPFSHVRPGCVIGNKVKIGSFVEVKAAAIGNDTKIPHLSYIGDAEIGERVNIGCGVITANHDGQKKHTTVIGGGAYIGCNATLVAPVTVGDRAFVAAGSTATHDVPPDAMAIARARQVNKEGYAKGRYKNAAPEEERV
jgi:bifunctional UDP-N-acetylglucosamine pyrophosphorylase/glucosamine-1-phosphate N-acetyltransferase